MINNTLHSNNINELSSILHHISIFTRIFWFFEQSDTTLRSEIHTICILLEIVLLMDYDKDVASQWAFIPLNVVKIRQCTQSHKVLKVTYVYYRIYSAYCLLQIWRVKELWCVKRTIYVIRIKHLKNLLLPKHEKAITIH